MVEKDKNDEIKAEDDGNEEEICTKNAYPTVFTKTVTLPMLLKSGVLSPGKSTMSIEYMGQKFIGDLLEDGKIKSQETETIFCSPSAWAINCKKIINPDKKSGCGWASVKYKGKKLDIYKAIYHKKCQQQKDQQDNPSEDEEKEGKEIITKPVELPVPPNKTIVQHSAICNRIVLHDIDTMVEAVPFSNVGRIQPFHINIASSVMLLMDFHCHLTTNEVTGYLGGTWDFNTQNLIITNAFPFLNSRFDREKTSECEFEIQKSMVEKNIQLVGWYHSHPRFAPQPTLRDCDKQLDYQIKLRGTSDSTYTPCVGFIFSTYDDENVENESKILPFWVLPPPENRPNELARPMLLSVITQDDQKLPDEIKEQMTACVAYYKQFQYELIDFSEIKLKEDVLALEKLKNTLFLKFPLEDQKTGHLWNWILELFGLNCEHPVIIPRKIIERQRQLEEEEKAKEEAAAKERLLREQELERKIREEREQEAAKQALNAISSLQQQLSQPSGLNMTPSPISSAQLTTSQTNNKLSSSSNATNVSVASSSPCGSPATIPSNATSPAKFEIPVRASPSPAKSDTSSIRGGARNSPVPNSSSSAVASKLPERPARNSSTVSSGSSKYDLGYSNNLSDLYAATLSSFAKSLPPGLLPADYTSLLQNAKLPMPDFGMSALGSLQASAAALSASNNFSSPTTTSMTSTSSSTSNKKSTSTPKHSSSTKNSNSGNNSSNSGSNSWLSQIPNMKEFMNQLEKGDLSVLMQSPYNIPTCKPTKNNKSAGTPTSSSSARTDYNHHEINQSSSSSSKRKGRPPNPTALSSSSSSAAAATSPYDYDIYKTDVGKISDLMKSPEYTQMLMNQANAFRSLGSEITVTRKPSTSSTTSSSSTNSKKSSSAAAAAAAAANQQASVLNRLPIMDLNYLAEISKTIPELNALLNSNKPEDINALLQMQMMAKNMDYASAFFGGAVGNTGNNSSNNNSNSNSGKGNSSKSNQMSEMSMLSQYMSGASNLNLFNPMYGMSGGTLTSLEKSAKELGANTSSRKRDNRTNTNSSSASSRQQSSANLNVAPNAADMLNSLFASATKSSGSQIPPDLSAYFSSPSAATSNSPSSKANNNSSSGGGIVHSAMDYSSIFSHMTPSKLQEMTSLFSQSKYPGIPDPLSANTLAANNAYLSPSLMKLQQEALNTQLMKPPKSSSSSSSSKIETPPLGAVSSPLSDKRSTPTKSLRDSPAAMTPKYNFSAADLAISSHAESSSRTPPVDLAMKDRNVPPKKRMEFSSIAELVAPSPTKRQKFSEDENDDEPTILNLSKN